MKLGLSKKLLFASLFTASLSNLVYADAASPEIEKEIKALMDRLGQSSCTFLRNDTEYPAAKAREHIMQKYDYIKGKGTVKSTEEFIELTATKSSMSNKPYQVKCNSQTTNSQAWMLNELKKIRKGK